MDKSRKICNFRLGLYLHLCITHIDLCMFWPSNSEYWCRNEVSSYPLFVFHISPLSRIPHQRYSANCLIQHNIYALRMTLNCSYSARNIIFLIRIFMQSIIFIPSGVTRDIQKYNSLPGLSIRQVRYRIYQLL